MPAPVAQSWWTAERIEQLTARLAAGETFAEVAIAIHAPSRNAVIGKARRLGLTRACNHHPAPHRRRKPKRTSALAKKVSMMGEPSAAIFENAKTLLELTGDDCRWPNGAPYEPASAFCAAPVEPGLPYCAYHARMAYAAVTPRLRR